jgi:hypothetical protein
MSEKKSETKKTRRSQLQRSIKRTIKTAEYESLVIEVGIEEEIEWSTLSERQEKIDNWTTLLLQDFKQSADRIVSDLGFTHKKAYFHNPSEETKEKFKAVAEAQERGLDLDDLDSLDTLGD